MFSVTVFFFFFVCVRVCASLKCRIRGTLYNLSCPYFSPKVMLRVNEKGASIYLSAILDIDDLLVVNISVSLCKRWGSVVLAFIKCTSKAVEFWQVND